jgi:Transmembrane protein of unknown function (DUF3556)
MGFLTPSPPTFDLQEFRRRPYLARMKPLAQEWAVDGFGTPTAIYLLYVLKLAVFAVGGLALIGAVTPGLGGLGEIGRWWTQPVVFQKVVVWLTLWEAVGLGCGSMPLTFRFIPPIGACLYWLRPGTVRMAPWPGRVPLTAGTRRTPLDVGLYAGVLCAALYLLLSDGRPVAGTAAGRLDTTGIAVLLGLLVALGLRDKVAFLAARPEIYGPLLIVSLFGVSNFIVGWQVVFLCIWLGAACSKLNRHFPFVVSVMISNTPWNRSRRAKAALYRAFPEDLRPSWRARAAAHLGTAIEFALPITLFAARGGPLETVAVIGMVAFHAHITSTFPLAVPLEWNLFMIFGVLFLFGHYGDVPLSTFHSAPLLVILLSTSVLVPVIGNFWPEKVSFLPAMRYYAGNWATSVWCFCTETGAEQKLDREIPKPAPIVIEQLCRLYDRELAEYLLNKGLAFRALHSHGRALTGLLARAVGEDVDAYDVREGELVSGVVNGWNFGDGHLHDQRLLAAVQERCHFAPGELRVIVLEAQPAHVQRQRYCIYDAAAGLLEEGWVRVADMVSRSPWLEESFAFPVEVIGRGASEAPRALATT